MGRHSSLGRRSDRDVVTYILWVTYTVIVSAIAVVMIMWGVQRQMSLMSNPDVYGPPITVTVDVPAR